MVQIVKDCYYWKYIVTLKDGNLKSVWEEIRFLNMVNAYIKNDIPIKKQHNYINELYKGYQNIEYKKHEINVVELIIKSVSPKDKAEIPDERFAHVTNFTLFKRDLKEINRSGRLRWKIENEGFNDQKNAGYNLQHKYSRTSFVATQNYYQCLQIAHMINPLAHKAKGITELINDNDTLKSNEEVAVAILMIADFKNETIIEEILKTKTQFRY